MRIQENFMSTLRGCASPRGDCSGNTEIYESIAIITCSRLSLGRASSVKYNLLLDLVIKGHMVAASLCRMHIQNLISTL